MKIRKRMVLKALCVIGVKDKIIHDWILNNFNLFWEHWSRTS